MPSKEVLCLSCGSADVVPKQLAGDDDLTWDQEDAIEAQPVEAGPWRCLRCDYEFTPMPCPYCGSYRIEGARGVSGMEFKQPLLVVQCMDCREEFPPHPSVIA